MSRAILFLLCSALLAETPVPRKNLIDDYIFGKLQKEGIPHAALTSDTEFLRRVTLDLTGRLPSVESIRRFTADKSPDKLEKLVDSLFPKLPTMGIGRRPTRVGP